MSLNESIRAVIRNTTNPTTKSARHVAREVIVTLKPVVDRHNETNRALVSNIHKVASNAGQRNSLEGNRMTLDRRAPQQDPGTSRVNEALNQRDNPLFEQGGRVSH